MAALFWANGSRDAEFFKESVKVYPAGRVSFLKKCEKQNKYALARHAAFRLRMKDAPCA